MPRNNDNRTKRHHRHRRLWRLTVILVPVLAGIAVAVQLAQNRALPERQAAEPSPRPVSVIEAPSVAVVPRAVGYGIARPTAVLRVVSEVDGRVVEMHPNLDEGAILPEGTVLLRIDPVDYELRIDELEAGIRVRNAQIQDLETREANAERSLAIELRSLEVARAELARLRELRSEGAVPESRVDEQERVVLQQERAVQSLQNEVARIPAERARLEAEIARERATLEQARRNLARTTLILPLDARIAEVNVERGQFVSPGQLLVIADSIAATEVPAQLPVDQLRAVLDQEVPAGTLNPAAIQTYLEAQGLSAVVRLRTGTGQVSWPARVDRLAPSLDPKTRTVGVIVTVERPYANARPPEQPPLVKGMYVQVEIRGRPRPNTLVIPRAALHQGQVYVVGENDRLEIRDVQVGFAQADFVAIESGLAAAEQVLVGDLVPAIAGTPLEPMTDEAAAARVAAQARGEKGP